MKTTTSRSILIVAVLALGAGCDGEVTTPDGGPTDTDSGPTTPTVATCQRYCDTVLASCTGDNAQYASEADCLAVCRAADWDPGAAVTSTGPADGPSIGCRTYHAGPPAQDDPAFHCPHAGPSAGGVCGSYCEAYCALALGGCTGGDALYGNGEACMAACANFDDSGTPGDASGDTVQCRIYHLSVAITTGETAVHCPHAAPDGGGVCVGGWDFRTDAPATYTRVDRMGMPAVSTALIGTARKDDYNDASPSLDGDPLHPTPAAAAFAGDIVASLTGLHTALDAQLAGLGLDPCSMSTLDPDNNLPQCIGQRVVTGGPRVAELVLPDVLTINTGASAAFPNGRRLVDPVIDVTLAVVLLDLGEHLPDTFANLPLNPPANDVAFSDDFPYLAAPHQP